MTPHRRVYRKPPLHPLRHRQRRSENLFGCCKNHAEVSKNAGLIVNTFIANGLGIFPEQETGAESAPHAASLDSMSGIWNVFFQNPEDHACSA